VIRPRRAALAAAAVVIAVSGVGTAWARPSAQAQNAQTVTGGDYRVVMKGGTLPATGPEDPVPVYALAGTVDLTMTNIGTVTPGSVRIVAGGGLALGAGIVICRVPFVGTNCATGQQVSFNTTTGLVDAPLPTPKQVWYVKAGGVLALGATLATSSTPPAKQTVNS
jgi:hypothetical protein